ncbi:MAG: hypothetical protein A2V81_04855 [Candidatus Abawacabacteria bacterium RBG_16_42_10]|uniref:HTH arsR-type domain-containing protein n=1 Tax=Candidatus Abawacabacteria bacterium RBG_16_42_10 TaxID=1817814 RepID=A0A1F4XJ24_9BACT|nr:MAG: hypothetical protein A2V81_04855 [Candidatus Abawacabacteria bacterium RBG_16_42_10]
MNTTCTKKCTDCFSLLADTTRLKIFTKVRGGISQVKELVKEIDVSQPTISHHLGLLAEHGVVTATKEGRETKYRFNPKYSCRECHIFEHTFRL